MRFVLTAISTILMLSVAGQSYYENDRSNKYFVTLGYGVGSTYWNSSTSNYRLFDQQGFILHDGDFGIKAHSASQQMSLELAWPIHQTHFGIGIAFDQYQLYKINIIDNTGLEEYEFLEFFRFDKFYAHLSHPLLEGRNGAAISAYGRLGYYRFSLVHSTSLFGEDRVGKTFFGAIGALADLPLNDWIYLFARPVVEYKHFTNHKREHPGMIKHHLFAWYMNGGLRFHIR